MRKALIAVVVAAGLFGVGAFAANFAVSADDVASGTNPVDSCADEVFVEWTTSDAVAEDGDFRVEGADLEIVVTEGRSCDGAVADIAVFLDDETGWVDGSCDDVAGTTTTCTFGEADIPVTPVVDVSVLLNGNTVDTSVGI